MKIVMYPILLKVKKLIFEKGYNFKKAKTSHGSEIYVTKFDQIVKVI